MSCGFEFINGTFNNSDVFTFVTDAENINY